MAISVLLFSFFFFNDTATTEIYTLSLHDALPILRRPGVRARGRHRGAHESGARGERRARLPRDARARLRLRARPAAGRARQLLGRASLPAAAARPLSFRLRRRAGRRRADRRATGVLRPGGLRSYRALRSR